MLRSFHGFVRISTRALTLLPLIAIQASAPALANNKHVSREVRDHALRSAKVWMQPEVPISEIDFSVTPPPPPGAPKFDENYTIDSKLTCDFINERPTGNSAKVYCELPNGKKLKVKLNSKWGESATETAASRLLTALGFFTDRMYQVAEVKCKGCPKLALPVLWPITKHVKLGPTSTYHFPVLERKYGGFEITTVRPEGVLEGWAFDELSRIDPAIGGSTRVEIDALRLMAVFLVHWDNNHRQHRMVCMTPGFKGKPDELCDDSRLVLHDIGNTFGHMRKDLVDWAKIPIWADYDQCTINLKDLPYEGGSLREVQIPESSRQFLAGLLSQLSHEQIRTLFRDSYFSTSKDAKKRDEEVDTWVRVFELKRRLIVDRKPCPLP